MSVCQTQRHYWVKRRRWSGIFAVGQFDKTSCGEHEEAEDWDHTLNGRWSARIIVVKQKFCFICIVKSYQNWCDTLLLAYQNMFRFVSDLSNSKCHDGLMVIMGRRIQALIRRMHNMNDLCVHVQTPHTILPVTCNWRICSGQLWDPCNPLAKRVMYGTEIW